jgi:hypothetical protein
MFLPSTLGNKRKNVTAALLAALLTSALTGTLLAKNAEADPILDMGIVPPKSTTTPPTVLILKPQNSTTTTTPNIWLTLEITPPRDPDTYRPNLIEVYYSASWMQDKVYVFQDLPHGLVWDKFSDTFEIEKVSQGVNSLTVTAVYYGDYYPYTKPGTEARFMISGSSTVNFAVDLKPLRIGIQAPYPQAYTESDVALAFTTNEETSRLQYCLDGQGNVTIAGNTTLTGLPAGSHNVTVYGWDAFGNPGNSETTTFTIAKPVLFPTSQLVAASAVASAAAICLALVVYFTKRKKKQASQQKITM